MLGYGVLLAFIASGAALPGQSAPPQPNPTAPRQQTSTPKVPLPKQPVTVGLGGEVAMEFEWVSALKMWVGKYEVTNGEYRRFKSEHKIPEWGKHGLNEDRQPVVLVNYDDAKAFADWLNKREREAGRLPEGCVYRLPDTTEWLTFAQCGDGRKYPFGNDMPPKYGNYADAAVTRAKIQWKPLDGYDDGFVATCPVEKSGENDWGLFGVGGNVWEWTSELYDEEHDWRILRGDCYLGQLGYGQECQYRRSEPPDVRDNISGFRLVLGRTHVDRPAPTTLPAVGKEPITGKPTTLDLGGGVGMEFVWVESLKMWVGKYETTNSEFRRYKPEYYVNDPTEGDRLPASRLNFGDIKELIAWIHRTYGDQLPLGYRLRVPTEAEWVAFAQCGDGRKYPWGNDWPPKFGNYDEYLNYAEKDRIVGYDDGFKGVCCPVERSGVNDWGLYGIGGNLNEGCADNKNQGLFGAWRGASIRYHGPAKVDLLLSQRVANGGLGRSYTCGFRLVLAPMSIPSKPGSGKNTDAAPAKDPPPPKANAREKSTPTSKVPPPGKPLNVELGGGVAMEFVWVEPLTMWMGKYEVTNGEFRKHVPKWHTGGGLRARFNQFPEIDINGDRQPVADMTWDRAKAFCQWLTDKARSDGTIGGNMAFRLPHDWVWSVAAGLDEERDGTPAEKDEKIVGEWPWGTQWPPPPGAGNYHGQEDRGADGRQRVTGTMIEGFKDDHWLSAPVGSFKPNKFGLYDMGGNVLEWCEDFYNGSDGSHVLRDSGWYVGGQPNRTLSSKRWYVPSTDSRQFELGFRVVCVDSDRVLPPPGTSRVAPSKTIDPPSPAAKEAAEKAPATLDLGDKVVMEFAWVEPLGMRVGKYEVTNGEFRRYKTDHSSGKFRGNSLDGDRQPAVGLSWDDARAYCLWLTENARKEGQIDGKLEYRLLHDWEWSVAVGLDEPREGTPQSKDGKLGADDPWLRKGLPLHRKPEFKVAGVFPWGTDWPPPKDAGNYAGTETNRGVGLELLHNDGHPVTSPVGSFKANKHGLHDMGGNVWEWCHDYYNGASGRRVLRGGCWSNSEPPRLMLSSIRALGDPALRANVVGFRIVCATSIR